MRKANSPWGSLPFITNAGNIVASYAAIISVTNNGCVGGQEHSGSFLPSLKNANQSEKT